MRALALHIHELLLEFAFDAAKLFLGLGTAGDGLSHRTIAAADEVVRIPMAGGVDSLNVAAAAAVAFWALRLP